MSQLMKSEVTTCISDRLARTTKKKMRVSKRMAHMIRYKEFIHSESCLPITKHMQQQEKQRPSKPMNKARIVLLA